MRFQVGDTVRVISHTGGIAGDINQIIKNVFPIGSILTIVRGNSDSEDGDHYQVANSGWWLYEVDLQLYDPYEYLKEIDTETQEIEI